MIELSEVIALITPLYLGIIALYVKVAKFERIADDFDRLKATHERIMEEGGQHGPSSR